MSEFTLPIFILFGKNQLGLSYFQAGSFYIATYATYTVLDFFGGTLADRFGRKRAFIAGVGLRFIGYLPFVITKSYPLLLLSSIVVGLGLALSSNSLDALVFEQSKAQDKKEHYQHGVANVQIFSFMGRIYASIVGGLVYIVSPTLPFFLTYVAILLALLVGAQTKFEVEGVTAAETKDVGISRAAISVYKQHHQLIKFVLVVALGTFIADLIFSYYQPYYIKIGVSAGTLGFIYAGISVCSALGAYSMKKLPNKLSPHTINSLNIALVIITSLVLYSLKIPFVYVAPLIMGLGSGLVIPNLKVFINHHAPNRVRASVLSMATTTKSLGTVAAMLVAYSLADVSYPRRVIGIVIVVATILLAFNVFIKTKEEANL